MTPRPGKISDIIDIPVSFPRNEDFRTSHEFTKSVRSTSDALHH
jgi:NitT/TauT family transport system ATP-binding protein